MAFAFVSSLFLIAAVIMLSNGTANQREIRPIEEQEYDILLRKNGRDIRVGSSGKTIYIDAKNC